MLSSDWLLSKYLGSGHTCVFDLIRIIPTGDMCHELYKSQVPRPSKTMNDGRSMWCFPFLGKETRQYPCRTQVPASILNSQKTT